VASPVVSLTCAFGTIDKRDELLSAARYLLKVPEVQVRDATGDAMKFESW